MQNAFCEHPLLKSWAPGQRGRSKPGSTKWRKKYCCYNQLNVICTKAMLYTRNYPVFGPFGTCYRLLACYCGWRQVSTWDQGMTHGSLSPLTATPAATESRPLCKNSSAATPSRAPYLTARQSWSIISPHYLSTTLSGLFILPFFLMKLKSRNFKCL